MKLPIAVLSILLSLPCLPAPEPQLASASRSFTIKLHAGFDRSFDAFGPVDEKNWSPAWDPTFIFRSGADEHPDFAVFTTAHDNGQVVWVMSVHDRDRGLIQYVNLDPGKLVTVIEIRCAKAGDKETRATVSYRRTALAESSNTAVLHFAEHFAEQGPHWEQAMNAYLDQQKQETK